MEASTISTNTDTQTNNFLRGSPQMINRNTTHFKKTFVPHLALKKKVCI